MLVDEFWVGTVGTAGSDHGMVGLSFVWDGVVAEPAQSVWKWSADVDCDLMEQELGLPLQVFHAWSSGRLSTQPRFARQHLVDEPSVLLVVTIKCIMYRSPYGHFGQRGRVRCSSRVVPW